MIAQQAIGKTYCNCLALERGLDPIGHADDFDDALVVEAPLPWKRDLYQQAGVLPQEIINLLALWLQEYRAGRGYRHRPLLIAPDPEYSRSGYRRVMFYTRPEGRFAQLEKSEYLVPLDELGALAWSLYQERDNLQRFAPYRVPEADSIREILVCTHGTVDTACAKFGYPLYKQMRDSYASAGLRVWRVSHFGGHVFAPTLMDMPTGHYWAYVAAAQAEQIVHRSGDVQALRGHYRGWCGIPSGFGQAAEAALWQQQGWAWFDYPKSGTVQVQDTGEAEPQSAQVAITYDSLDNTPPKTADLRIEVSHTLETESSTGQSATRAYPQYKVTPLEPT